MSTGLIDKATKSEAKPLRSGLFNLLKYPDIEGAEIDSPEVTIARWQLIRKKTFLCRIYQQWYERLASAVPPGPEAALEIGSGSGFLKDYLSDLICSDILPLPNCDMVVDACAELPFSDNSLRAVLTNNTFHHLPAPRVFLSECERVLKPGGVLTMVEPWVSPWSSLIYKNLHHEPFIVDTKKWEFDSSGPLSGANGALAWIVFERDRLQFECEFPGLRVEKVRGLMPFSYILSGGVSMRSLVPNFSYDFFAALEDSLEPYMDKVAMFAHIVVRKET